MSGYLADLVARAAGPPRAAVSPRLPPLFPVGPLQHRDELPSPEAQAEVSPPARPSPADLHADDRSDRLRSRARPDDGADVGRPVRARPAPAPDAPSTAPPARASQPTEGAAAEPSRAALPAPAESAERRRPDMDARPDSVASPVTVSARVEARLEPAPTPVRPPAQEATPPPAPPVVVAQPRASPTLPPARPATAPAPRDRAPQIEVRIGRVEIRRPSLPEPFQWQAPAPEPQTVAGFGELAAARRYVDRCWS